MFAMAMRMLAKKSKAKKPSELVNLKIGIEERQWSGALREILKEQGPLTAGSFWEHAQDSGITSKKHMKMILRWMRDQNHVKLVRNHKGDTNSPTSTEFLYKDVVARSDRMKLGNAQESKEGKDAPKPEPEILILKKSLGKERQNLCR